MAAIIPLTAGQGESGSAYRSQTPRQVPSSRSESEVSLVLEFLFTFSRFEYALKRAGYRGQDGEAAKAEWDRFENDLTALSGDELAPVLARGEYILTTPPKKQVAHGGGLGWEDSAPTASRIKTVLIYVCRVRNNLFHGGKFPEGPVHDVARDRDLLRAGISVLRALLKVPSLPGGIGHYLEEEG
jgi:hypothetical protein